MKIGKYEVPTPLLIGGIAGVGALVIGQRLGGAAPAEVAPTPGEQAGGGASPAGVGDLWTDAEVGQFPSFPPSTPTTSPGYGWWDDESPPPPAGPINVPTQPTDPVAPATPTTWYPARLGVPPAAATGYIAVSAGSLWWYTVSGTRITGRRSATSGGFSAYVSGPRTYTWPGNTSRALLRVLTGSHAGKYIALNESGVRFVRKP